MFLFLRNLRDSITPSDRSSCDLLQISDCTTASGSAANAVQGMMFSNSIQYTALFLWTKANIGNSSSTNKKSLSISKGITYQGICHLCREAKLANQFSRKTAKARMKHEAKSAPIPVITTTPSAEDGREGKMLKQKLQIFKLLVLSSHYFWLARLQHRDKRGRHARPL